MKTLSKLKLNQLSKTELDQRRMNALKGGVGGCVCGWCGCVGSSIATLDAVDAGRSQTAASITADCSCCY